MFITLLAIFVLGYIGYRVLSYFHVPGGAVTGALVALALITSQGVQWAVLPSYITTFFQVIIGVMIGCRFQKDQIATLKSLLVPGLLSSVWMIVISLGVGLLLCRVTGMDIGSSLFGSSSGVFKMGLIALTYNLNVPAVTFYCSLSGFYPST